MSDRPQRERLLQMLGQMEEPKLPKRALSELLYTAQENNIICEDSPLENVELLYKLITLSKTITQSELDEIRM